MPNEAYSHQSCGFQFIRVRFRRLLHPPFASGAIRNIDPNCSPGGATKVSQAFCLAHLAATLPVKCGAASLPKEAHSVTARPSKAGNSVAAILRQLRHISTLTSGERQVPQFRCKLIGPLEFLLCVGFLTLLTKRQGEIVVCLGVAWLQARCLFKCCLCPMNIASLQ